MHWCMEASVCLVVICTNFLTHMFSHTHHTCTHTHAHTHTHTHTIHAHTHMHTHTHTHTHTIHAHTHMHTHVHTYTHTLTDSVEPNSTILSGSKASIVALQFDPTVSSLYITQRDIYAYHTHTTPIPHPLFLLGDSISCMHNIRFRWEQGRDGNGRDGNRGGMGTEDGNWGGAGEGRDERERMQRCGMR